MYEAGYSPICPVLFQPYFLHPEVPQEAKDRTDMAAELLRRSRILVVCGNTATQEVKNDIALAKHLRITATTLEGILNVDGRSKADREAYEMGKTIGEMMDKCVFGQGPWSTRDMSILT